MRNISDYSNEYLVQGFEKYQVKYRRKKVLERIYQYAPRRILEIGCGMEPLFLHLPKVSFTIVEPSEIFCKNAVQLVKNDVRDINVVNGLLEDKVDTLSKNYDMIICSGLLHEVEKPDKILECIRQICKKDTVVHVNVPNAMSLHRILAEKSRMILNVHDMSERNKRLQQNVVFDMDSLLKLVKNVKGEVIAQGSYFVKPFTHQQMYQMLQQNIINEQVLDGLYGCIEYMPELGSEIFADFRFEDNGS